MRNDRSNDPCKLDITELASFDEKIASDLSVEKRRKRIAYLKQAVEELDAKLHVLEQVNQNLPGSIFGFLHRMIFRSAVKEIVEMNAQVQHSKLEGALAYWELKFDDLFEEEEKSKPSAGE